MSSEALTHLATTVDVSSESSSNGEYYALTLLLYYCNMRFSLFVFFSCEDESGETTSSDSEGRSPLSASDLPDASPCADRTADVSVSPLLSETRPTEREAVCIDNAVYGNAPTASEPSFSVALVPTTPIVGK